MSPGRYLRFLGLALAIVAVLMAIGVMPTRRLAGDDAVAAMAGWLLIAVNAGTPEMRMQRAFLAMAVRLAVVGALGLAAALSGAVDRMPLLFWLAAAYVALLPLEVKLAIT